MRYYTLHWWLTHHPKHWLEIILGHELKGYSNGYHSWKISRKRTIQCEWIDLRCFYYHWRFYFKHTLPYLLKTTFTKKNLKANLWILFTRPEKQEFLAIPVEKYNQESRQYEVGLQIAHKYSLFTTPYGHLPLSLAWKINRKKLRNNFRKFAVRNRWRVLSFPCRSCKGPTQFKNSLCSECYECETANYG